MTSKITLIIGIAVTALAFGVPTALGEGRLAGSPEQDGVSFFYANERATLAQQSVAPGVSRPDSHDIVRADVGGGYIDAADRARRIDTIVPTPYLDAFERSAPPKGSPAVSTEATGSGSDRDWSQLGIGFGLGLLLAVGLFAAMRMTRIRPLAH
jgi:hypothetical protein